MMSRILQCLMLAAGLLLTPAIPALSHDGDAGAIIHLMMATFDKPDNHLTVEPVVVGGDWAIAGWSQGDMGGRALLKRKGDVWVLHLCAGDSLKQAKALADIGIDPTLAEALAADLGAAEAKLDPARLALFSKFEGVVMMGDDGSHPPADGHHAHGDAGHAAGGHDHSQHTP